MRLRIRPNYFRNFRILSSFSISVLGVVFLPPFGINNFLQGRVLLGILSFAVIGICLINSIVILKGRYLDSITTLFLVPALIIFLALAIYKQHIIGVLWAYPAIISINFMLSERKAWVATAILVSVSIPLIFIRIELPIAIRASFTLILLSVFVIAFIHIIQNHIKNTERDIKQRYSDETTDNARDQSKYRFSPLDDARLLVWSSRILDYMKEEKPYTDPDFSMEDMSQALDISRNYISQTLNQHMNTNFYNLVNSYRIADIQSEIKNQADERLNFLNLAYKYGFNSKSTFQKAFKSATGMTPSQYHKNCSIPADQSSQNS